MKDMKEFASISLKAKGQGDSPAANKLLGGPIQAFLMALSPVYILPHFQAPVISITLALFAIYVFNTIICCLAQQCLVTESWI